MITAGLFFVHLQKKNSRRKNSRIEKLKKITETQAPKLIFWHFWKNVLYLLKQILQLLYQRNNILKNGFDGFDII